MNAKAVYEVADLVGGSVRRVGQFIDSHPRSAGRDAGVTLVQMLMKMIAAEADNCDVHSLYAFGA